MHHAIGHVMTDDESRYTPEAQQVIDDEFIRRRAGGAKERIMRTPDHKLSPSENLLLDGWMSDNPLFYAWQRQIMWKL